jgi:hypothetical protein
MAGNEAPNVIDEQMACADGAGKVCARIQAFKQPSLGHCRQGAVQHQ